MKKENKEQVTAFEVIKALALWASAPIIAVYLFVFVIGSILFIVIASSVP